MRRSLSAPRCGQSCSPGCTSPVLWHSVCADNCPRFPSPAHPAVPLPLLAHIQASRGSSRTHLSRRVRPPRGTDRAPQGASSSAWAPSSNRPSPTTGAFHAAGCVSFRAGAFDAVGDSNPVPQRAGCPRPHRNVPTRAKCPQPRRPSTGHPWHPEPLVRQLHQRRRPTTTSGPHTGARSGQTGEGAASSRGGEAPSPEVQAAARGVEVPDSHR